MRVKWFFFNILKNWGFSKKEESVWKKIEKFSKLLQVSILLFNATGMSGFSERSTIGVLFHKRMVFRKTSQLLLRNAKGSKCDKERDWNGRNSQNVHILKFLRKKDGSFEKKLECFQIT